MNTSSLTNRLPKSLRSRAQVFLETSHYPGPKTSVADSSPDKVLLDSEARISETIALDNTAADSNRALGSVETDELRVLYQKGEQGLEFYSEGLGDGPYRIVSLSQVNGDGMNTVLAMTDPQGSVLRSGAIHLDRHNNEESFVAGDLKGL